MNDIERILKEKRDEIGQVEVPAELEERLSKALEGKTRKRFYMRSISRIAAVMAVFILIGYNFDTMAFYAKRLVGYKKVMNDTISQLNENGWTQPIEKSIAFENGVSIDLDGIMLDENRIILFFKMKSEGGNIDEMMPRMELEGMMGSCHESVSSMSTNEEETEMTVSKSFGPPYFFEKTMKLKIEFLENGGFETGEIEFKIDREKAMGHSIKKDVDEKFEIELDGVENIEIGIGSIFATPTKTVVSGNMRTLPSDGSVKIESIRTPDIDLSADGDSVSCMGGSASSGGDCVYEFEYDYDAIVGNPKMLEFKVNEIEYEQRVDKRIDISGGYEGKKLEILGEEVWIDRIYQEEGLTLIEFSMQDRIALSNMYVEAGGEKITDSGMLADWDKSEDGGINVATVEFETLEEIDAIMIESVETLKECDYTIQVPVK